MFCPTTMRFLALGGLALVVIVGVVLLATRRPILGLIIGLAVLALGGLLALPAFWLRARPQPMFVRTSANTPRVPDTPAAPEASVVAVSDGCVVAITIPDLLLLDEESGCALDEPPTEVDDVPIQTAWRETVRKLADSLRQLARSRQADLKLRQRLRRLRQDRFDDLASKLLHREWPAFMRDARPAAASDECGTRWLPQVRFDRDDILIALGDSPVRLPRGTARPRNVVLSVLLVFALVLFAYLLLKRGMRRAATRNEPARWRGCC